MLTVNARYLALGRELKLIFFKLKHKNDAKIKVKRKCKLKKEKKLKIKSKFASFKFRKCVDEKYLWLKRNCVTQKRKSISEENFATKKKAEKAFSANKKKLLQKK